jgi:hypothetical protein
MIHGIVLGTWVEVVKLVPMSSKGDIILTHQPIHPLHKELSLQ